MPLPGFLKENPMGKNPSHLPFKSLFSDLKSSIPKLPSPSPPPWPCPSSNKPNTLSFQLFDETVGSVNQSSGLASTVSSSATTSSPLEPAESSSTTAASADFHVRVAMQAVRSERLFFDGGGSSNRSLMSNNVNVVEVRVPFEGSVAVEMESKDPYRDFRASMEEMVKAEGGVGKNGWVWFEEMLVWYLRLNKRWAHEFIVGAYCDVLTEMMMMVPSSSCSSVGDRSCSCCLSKSSSYASCVSAIEEEEEEGKR